MEQQENTLDEAIKDCKQKVEYHRKRANSILRTLIVSFLVFILLLVGKVYVSYYNQLNIRSSIIQMEEMRNRLTFEMEDLSRATSYKESIINDELTKLMHGYINFLNRHSYDVIDTISFDPYARRQIFSVDTTIFGLKRNINSTLSALRTLPAAVESSNVELNPTVEYIVYGIFILIFGVFASFYRFLFKRSF